jgi:hypothetical protein
VSFPYYYYTRKRAPGKAREPVRAGTVNRTLVSDAQEALWGVLKWEGRPLRSLSGSLGRGFFGGLRGRGHFQGEGFQNVSVTGG